ncbi:MAG: PQQ-binding-like beta-propeller repeat protein [archaeon]|nr:PQQ-binding-like beta-propeller repeat protein [Candidatus Bathyarchaeum sp.]
MLTKKSKKINKTVSVCAIIFLLSFELLLLSSSVSAETTLSGYTPMPDRDTDTFVGVSPTLIGLGQELVINAIVYPAPSGPTYEAFSLIDELNEGYSGVSVTIIDPDGNEETFMPIDMTLSRQGIDEPGKTQIVGHLMFVYKPTKVGDYTITADFPGQFFTTDPIHPTAKLSVYYKPSSSKTATSFSVQSDLVNGGLLNGYPWSSLPDGYWENPVQTDNREWAAISGDWTQACYDITGTNYNPYSAAPNSPHIIWSRTISESGLIGGIWGSLPYQQSGSASGSGPRPKFAAIMDGNLYRNTQSGFEAVDIRTGEQLWEVPGTITQAQRLDLPFQTESQVSEGGISSWLWGISKGKWTRYDPTTGSVIQTINVPTDLAHVMIDDGDPIIWCLQADLSLWNTTKPLGLPYVNLIKWDFNKLISTVGYSNLLSSDWAAGIVFNVSAQTGALVDIGDSKFSGPRVFPFREAGVVVVRNKNAMQITAGFDYYTGELIWAIDAVLNLDVLNEGVAASSSGPHITKDGASNNYVAYDVQTGEEIWRAAHGEYPWGALPSYSYVYHDGVDFFGSYDGHVYAYSTNDGSLIWKSEFNGETFETLESTQPFNGKAIGADGKLYFSTATPYQMMPRPRFKPLVCIDEYTGEFLWKLPIDMMPMGIADGYLICEDIDNGVEYGIGKGPTTTTVSATYEAVILGSSTIIKGTVTDQSPGSPNTPAISDEDMSEWMDYLYGQNATLLNNPPTPKGVTVKLEAIDPNGNYQNLGTTISDSYGNYGFTCKPKIEGQYTIIATFEGSESYFGSSATTYLTVDPAITPSTAIDTEEPVNTETPISSEEPPAATSTDFTVLIILGIVAAVVGSAYWIVKRK